MRRDERFVVPRSTRSFGFVGRIHKSHLAHVTIVGDLYCCALEYFLFQAEISIEIDPPFRPMVTLG